MWDPLLHRDPLLFLSFSGKAQTYLILEFIRKDSDLYGSTCLALFCVYCHFLYMLIDYTQY